MTMSARLDSSDLAKAVYINKGETGMDAEGFDKRSNVLMTITMAR